MPYANNEKQLEYWRRISKTPKRIAQVKASRLKHAEKIRAYDKLRRDKFFWRAYRAKKPGLYKRYCQRNKIDRLNQQRAWINRNREKTRLYARRSYSKYKAIRDAKSELRRRENPEWGIRAAAKRRALKKAATINLAGIRAFVSSVKKKRLVTCYYCKDVILSSKCHFDHIVPLALGGFHSAENLCVSCPKCNHSKHARTLDRWMRNGQQILNL